MSVGFLNLLAFKLRDIFQLFLYLFENALREI